MRIKTVGLAVLVAGSMMGDALAQQTLEDEIQQEEAPGSAIEMDIGRGGVVIGRQRNRTRRLSKLKARFWTLPTIRTRRSRPTRSTLSCRAKDLKISQVPTTTIRSPSKQSSSAGRVRRCRACRRLGGFVAGVAPLPSARHEPTSKTAEALACGFNS